MINLFLKSIQGAVTLVFTVVLLVMCTMMIIFAANYGQMETTINANSNRDMQAFEAAEAGLEYGISYLRTNYTTIIASPAGGFIQSFTNGSVTNVAMANGSHYSIVYTNPIASNYGLIKITSTGTSDDGLATHVVTQQIAIDGVAANPPNMPLVSRGAVNVTGNGNVINLESNQTITSGSTISFNGNGKTTTPTGPGNGSDLAANQSGVAALSDNDLFATYFGMSANAVRSGAQYYYTNNSSTNYSGSLNGKSGSVIWIDQVAGSATISANTTIGTASNPVILIVNGDLDLSGNVTINGLVFVYGKSSAVTDITGNVTINGALVTGDNIGMSGNSNIVYDSSLLNKFNSIAGTNFFAKLPGSWKDF